MRRKTITVSLIVLALFTSVSGCATISTVSQAAHERRPLIMSGTRLDVASLLNKPELRARYGVSPPKYPLLDLPFSVVFDVLVLGYSIPVSLLRN